MSQPIHNAALAGRAAQVQIHGLGKSFRAGRTATRVLDDVSLEVAEGEMLVLLGPSGCGKTTLLRCVVGLEQPDEGTIRLAGSTMVDAATGVFVPAERRGVGMVFQNYSLWPHMTVAGNVEYPLRARGLKQAIAEGRVKEVLDIVQCGHLAERYPPQLSGGQQQRVALARALASRPKVMLLDEPLSNLDALLRIDLRAQLRQLHRNLGFTGIYVTHDQVEAMNLATRIVVMRAGRIEQIGDPQLIHRTPATDYVAEFLGMRNKLPCRVSQGGRLEVAGASMVLGAGGVPGDYHIRARPSEIALRPQGGAGSGDAERLWIAGGRVLDRMPSGETTDHIVALGDLAVFVELRGNAVFEHDQPVEIGIERRKLLLYDADGALAPFSPWLGS